MDEQARKAREAAARQLEEEDKLNHLRHLAAEERARERRWSYPGKSCVEHPKYGSIIVPHGSNLSAIENAAEYWGCELSEIISTARVWACDQSLPAVKRPEGRRTESWSEMLARLEREQEEKKLAEAAANAARREEKKRTEEARREYEESQCSLFAH